MCFANFESDQKFYGGLSRTQNRHLHQQQPRASQSWNGNVKTPAAPAESDHTRQEQ